MWKKISVIISYADLSDYTAVFKHTFTLLIQKRMLIYDELLEQINRRNIYHSLTILLCLHQDPGNIRSHPTNQTTEDTHTRTHRQTWSNTILMAIFPVDSGSASCPLDFLTRPKVLWWQPAETQRASPFLHPLLSLRGRGITPVCIGSQTLMPQLKATNGTLQLKL